MAIADRKEHAGEIFTSSLVSASTREGVVEIEWGERKCQFTPTEARQFALTVLATAEAAEMDAIVLEALTTEMQITPEKGVHFIGLLRSHRTRREPEAAN